MMTTNEKWVSPEDTTTYLLVVWGPAYRWLDPRGLPAHKIGHSWRFKCSQVHTLAGARGAESDDVAGGAG